MYLSSRYYLLKGQKIKTVLQVDLSRESRQFFTRWYLLSRSHCTFIGLENCLTLKKSFRFCRSTDLCNELIQVIKLTTRYKIYFIWEGSERYSASFKKCLVKILTFDLAICRKIEKYSVESNYIRFSFTDLTKKSWKWYHLRNFRTCPLHSLEITDIYSHSILANILWNQSIQWRNY